MALVVAAAAGLPGCTHYRPAPLAAVSPGARVRVALTPDGQSALAPTLGTAVRGVEGAWLGPASGDSVTVRVDRLMTMAGVTMAWTGGAVAMPRGAIATVEPARPAPRRTLALVGGIALAVIAAVSVIRMSGGGQGAPGGEGPTPF